MPTVPRRRSVCRLWPLGHGEGVLRLARRRGGLSCGAQAQAVRMKQRSTTSPPSFATLSRRAAHRKMHRWSATTVASAGVARRRAPLRSRHRAQPPRGCRRTTPRTAAATMLCLASTCAALQVSWTASGCAADVVWWQPPRSAPHAACPPRCAAMGRAAATLFLIGAGNACSGPQVVSHAISSGKQTW